VRLDRAEGYVIIEGKAYPAKEIVEALAQSGYTQLKAVGDSLMFGNRRITPIFKSRQERAMASLCHASLAYCCPLSKRCADRDRALEMLGLTQDDYERLKAESHTQFVEVSRGLSSREDSDQRDDINSGSADRQSPARDYASDDYRRDFETLDRSMQSNRPSQVQVRNSDHWSSGQPYPSEQQESPFSEGRINGPFNDDGDQHHRGEQRRPVGRDKSSAAACRSCSGDAVEGLGSLFAQGELSPFVDDARTEESRRDFCFSCGRSLKQGTRVCPYCGSTR
jgi:predicted metal-binding transcription factor (methanogenesis marker protein 9)